MSTTPKNMQTKPNIFNKQMKLGPLDFTFIVWLMIFFVFIAVFVYFTRYYGTTPTIKEQDKGYYYY